MSHQLPEEQKQELADFVIHSDDNKPLLHKMKKLLEELIEIRNKQISEADTY